jgi:hypothetical protein
MDVAGKANQGEERAVVAWQPSDLGTIVEAAGDLPGEP